MGSREASGEGRPPVVKILNQAEKVVYDGVARALLVTVGMLFFSVETSTLAVFEVEPLETAPTDPRPGAFEVYLRRVVAVARENDRDGMTSPPEAETLLSPLPAIASGLAG